MGNQEQNYIVKSTYSFIRLMGTAAGLVRDGLNVAAPLLNLSESMENNDFPEIKKRVSAPINRVISKPLKTANTFVKDIKKEIIAPIVNLETTRPAQSSVWERPNPVTFTEAGSFWNGIEFDNRDVFLKAKIYVNEFDSTEAVIRLNALDDIKKLPSSLAIAILKKMLLLHGDSIRVMEIINALSSLNTSLRIQKNVFLKHLHDNNPRVRLAAIRALAKYKDQEGFSILSSAIRDKNAGIRKQSLNMLCWAYQDKCEKAVVTLLYDIDLDVKKTAVKFSSILKISQSVSPLIALLSDSDFEVQKSVVDALRKITGESFGFNATGSMRSKEDALSNWSRWWRENQSTFEWELRKTAKV